MDLQMSFANWWRFCLGFNVLKCLGDSCCISLDSTCYVTKAPKKLFMTCGGAGWYNATVMIFIPQMPGGHINLHRLPHTWLSKSRGISWDVVGHLNKRHRLIRENIFKILANGDCNLLKDVWFVVRAGLADELKQLSDSITLILEILGVLYI